MIPRRLLLCVVVLCLLTAASAAPAGSKVERTGALPAAGVSDGLRQSVEDKGYRVTLDDGWTAEFWFAKPLKTAKKDAPGALYPELTDGEFVGVVKFSQGFSDYRGQSVAAGVYTLRYQLLPQDGNHMGVSPDPDFLLLSPAGVDSRPAQNYMFNKLVVLSSKSTSTNHPAVMALEAAGEAPSISKSDHGTIIFSVAVPTDGTAAEKLGLVLKGAAAQ